MRFPMHSTALPADMFRRVMPNTVTTLTMKEYEALRQAAIDKKKLPEFKTWLRQRKVVIK